MYVLCTEKYRLRPLMLALAASAGMPFPLAAIADRKKLWGQRPQKRALTP